MDVTDAEAQACATSDGDRRALAVGRKWVEAVNRRDADALIEITHAQATVHPTLLLPDSHGPYRGHAGVREWIAALVAGEPLAEHISEVPPAGGSRVVGLGRVSINGRQLSRLSIVLSIENGKVTAAHAYLSDEDELRDVGHLPDRLTGPRDPIAHASFTAGAATSSDRRRPERNVHHADTDCHKADA